MADFERGVRLETRSLRKIRKPLIERKRRERINRCLGKLKDIIVDHVQGGVQVSKLDKAEILEMTVKHLSDLRTKPPTDNPNISRIHSEQQRAGYRACAREAIRFIGSTCTNKEVQRRLQQHVGCLSETGLNTDNNNARCSKAKSEAEVSKCFQPISIVIPQYQCVPSSSNPRNSDVSNSLLIPVTMYSSVMDQSVTDGSDVSFDVTNDSGVFSNTSTCSPSSSVDNQESPALAGAQELIWRPW